MKFGFIGACTVAKTITHHVLPFGHEVLLSNNREPEIQSGIVAELGACASAGNPQEAADQDVVVLSVTWPSVPEALASILDWSSRILIDATNRIDPDDPSILGDLSGPPSSEIVADLAPGANAIKAFNTLPISWIDDTSPDGPRTVLFMSGDYAEDKKAQGEVLDQVGFAEVDLGGLAAKGDRQQQLAGPVHTEMVFAKVIGRFDVASQWRAFAEIGERVIAGSLQPTVKTIS